MSTRRVTTGDLELAATWLESYNDGEVEDDRGVDEAAGRMFAVAEWLRDEVARRERAALIARTARVAASEIAQRTGVPVDDPRVVRHANKMARKAVDAS